MLKVAKEVRVSPHVRRGGPGKARILPRAVGLAMSLPRAQRLGVASESYECGIARFHEGKYDEAIDAFVRKKIESQKRQILEGSDEWDVMYRKYYEEETQKRRKVMPA